LRIAYYSTHPWSLRSASTILRLAITWTTVNVHTLPWSLTASQEYLPASQSSASAIVSVHFPPSVRPTACLSDASKGSPSLNHLTRGSGTPRTCHHHIHFGMSVNTTKAKSSFYIFLKIKYTFVLKLILFFSRIRVIWKNIPKNVNNFRDNDSMFTVKENNYVYSICMHITYYNICTNYTY